MDPDELLVFVSSLGVAAWAGFRWYRRLANAGPPYSVATPRVRLILAALPIALLVGLNWALEAGAAREVREDTRYAWLFLALGAAWIALAWKVTSWLGIDVGDDALERNNSAACVATCGALGGSITIYGFANIGEGPTIWTTIGPAALGGAAAVALMAVYQSVSDAADAITIDRDLASGMRFAGLTLGGGLILGRPLAGDYVSAANTLGKFFGQAWPALPLVGLAAWIEQRLLPNSEQPRPDALQRGLLPSLGYLVVGVLDLIHLGLPTAIRTPP